MRNPIRLLLCALISVAGCDASSIDPGAADMRRVRDLAEPADPDPDDAGTPAGPPDLLPDKAGPPYPIVLVHGMAGFRNIGPIEYFYGVPEALRKDGHDVWVSRQDPINDSEVRGRQTLDYVQMVLLATGKAKVNLIGHSQGGFDVRYVASTIGARVASVTMVASPMEGAPIADLAINGTGPAAKDALSFLLNIYGAVGGFNSNAKAQLTNLTSAGAKAFFAKHPDDNRVAYYSITGRSDNTGPDVADCIAPAKPPFIAKWDQYRDPMDVLFQIPTGIMNGMNPRPVHDGLVTVLSARHGVFLGCIPADHMDEVGQLVGDSPGGGNRFDHVQFYRDLAAWIKSKGF